jgi:hypothetical protein
VLCSRTIRPLRTIAMYPVLDCLGFPFSVLPAWEWDALGGPAVYMLCRREHDGSVTILYIGECEDLPERIGPRHEKRAAATRLGMTEVHVHLLARTRHERLAVETRLRAHYPTRLNAQSPAMHGLGLLGEFSPRFPARNALAPFALAPAGNALRPFASEPVNALLTLAPFGKSR